MSAFGTIVLFVERAIQGLSAVTGGRLKSGYTAVAILALAAPLAIACGRPSEWHGLAKVGLTAPFSGYSAPIGYQVLSGVRAALRELNETGGVAGTRLELVALDDQGNVGSASERVAELARDPDVAVSVSLVLGSDSGALARAYAAGGLPALLVGSPLALEPSGIVRPTCAGADEEGRLAATLVASTSIAAVVTTPGEGYHSAAKSFAVAVNGRSERFSLPSSSVDKETAEHLARILASRAIDFVYVSGTHEAGLQLVAELRLAGFTGRIILGSAVDPAGAVQARVPYVSSCHAKPRAPEETAVRKRLAGQGAGAMLLGYDAVLRAASQLTTVAGDGLPVRKRLAEQMRNAILPVDPAAVETMP